MTRVASGLDVLLARQGGRWRGLRAGLILHQASVTRDLRPAAEALAGAGLRPAALFAPEHGFAGALQDQIAVRAVRDRRTGLPVHSLYGDPARPLAAQRSRLAPAPETLQSLDVLIFDLQDIGVRYYTFIWTMALAMEAAGRAGVPFLVLDRPNPLGGTALEGNIPDPAYASFVGLYPLPVRHGMTAGEIALYLNEKYRLGAELHVVKMRGWRREMRHGDTGLPWVLPSPNMPTPDTASVYAGMCLLEATNLSEGRGTTRPFEIVGAPFLDAEALARRLNALPIPGASFRPCSFQPTFHKWAGRTCHGVQVHVTDPDDYPSFLTGLLLIQAARQLAPRSFRWKPPPYEYELRKPPIDILCGTDETRRAVESGGDLRRLEKKWEPALRRFRRERVPYLLY